MKIKIRAYPTQLVVSLRELFLLHPVISSSVSQSVKKSIKMLITNRIREWTLFVFSLLIVMVVLMIWYENGSIRILSKQASGTIVTKNISSSTQNDSQRLPLSMQQKQHQQQQQQQQIISSFNKTTNQTSSDNKQQQIQTLDNNNNDNTTIILMSQPQHYNTTISILDSNNRTTFQEENKIPENYTTVRDGKTTVIITSNLIPSHPSLWMINETIASISSQLIGLEEDYKLIISVDGLHRKFRRNNKHSRTRLRQYKQALSMAYPNATILSRSQQIGLTLNFQICLESVTTEFVYLLQHDMPFSRKYTISHTALIQVAREETQGYPFCVRFNKDSNRYRRINRAACFFNSTLLTHSNTTGLDFIKTAVWSDKYVKILLLLLLLLLLISSCCLIFSNALDFILSFFLVCLCCVFVVISLHRQHIIDIYLKSF
jgi:hypothetical protein